MRRGALYAARFCRHQSSRSFSLAYAPWLQFDRRNRNFALLLVGQSEGYGARDTLDERAWLLPVREHKPNIRPT